MSRVPWTRYEGEDIEALCAMFVSAQHPAAVRITPSTGDGGIDILVRTENKTSVYQVKKFSSSLTSGQKKKITESVDRLCSDPRVAHLTVDEWHLVMPWDPTIEAYDWLSKYVTGKGLPIPIWDGLTNCDEWAAKYPHIVDYYLHGNEERIRSAAMQIVHGLRLKNIRGEEIKARDISGFATELGETISFLNQEDPFYTYGIRVEPQVENPSRENLENALAQLNPGVVFSTIQGNDQVKVQIDVYPKNAVAFQLAPLKVDMSVTVRKGSVEHAAVQDYVKFGSPMQLQSGVSGSTVAPGGLGETFEDAGVVVLPKARISDEDREMRFVLLDGEGHPVDSIMVTRQYMTWGAPTGPEGAQGAETHFIDSHRILEIVIRIDPDEGEPIWSFKINTPAGKIAQDVLTSLRFVKSMRAPNSLVLAPRFGPLPNARKALGKREKNVTDTWLEIAEALNLIQEHTALRLRIPHPERIEADLVHEIICTGAILRGEKVILKTEQIASAHNPEESKGVQSISMIARWSITLNEGWIDLGYLAHTFSGSVTQRALQTSEGLSDLWNVNGKEVVVRMLSEEEQKALPDLAEL